MANRLENLRDRLFSRLNRQTGIYHILWWTFYFVMIGVLMVGVDQMQLHEYLGWLVINVPVKLAIFYTFYSYLVPNWLGRKTWSFIGVVILLMLVYPPLKYGFDSLFAIKSLPSVQFSLEEDHEYLHWQELARRFNTILGLVPFSIAVRITVDWFKNQQMKKELERRRMQGELDLLRNQVNPHFLFNVLNSIDSLIYKVSPEGSEAVHKLSAIMRYMLYDSNANHVLLNSEIEYLSSYFDLQRIRMKATDVVNFECKGPVAGQKIAPMLFIVFVENAFKHANIIDGRRVIEVSIEMEDSLLRFNCRNSYDPNHLEQKDKVGGIGLKNVERRLDLLYENRYALNTHVANGYYTVSLNVNLEEPEAPQTKEG
ncbi:MAG: histidine kinase [Cytophagales bacterium]|nr:histidine kinase [Cytophagales bacterium]